jgi:hypothetical protein
MQKTVRLIALLCVAIGGCESDAIRHYRVVRVEPPAQRLLGAILPHADKVWFVKLSGPTEQVAAQKQDFDSFVASIRFVEHPDEPVQWTAPPHWRPEKATGMRYASFKVGPQESPLEVTVIPLGLEAASILDNVNRWRSQIGLDAIGEQELETVVTRTKIGSITATIVDMTGSGESESSSNRAGRRRESPELGAAPVAGRPPDVRIRYQTPAGWTKQATDAQGFRVASFVIVEGGHRAEVSVTPLPGTAGGLLQNVNRWRSQVDLGPWSEAELQKNARSLAVAGKPAHYVDVGPGPGSTQRILAVTAERAGQTWFFKLMGPAELVARHKEAFESFVQSVQFSGGQDASGEHHG